MRNRNVVGGEGDDFDIAQRHCVVVPASAEIRYVVGRDEAMGQLVRWRTRLFTLRAWRD